MIRYILTAVFLTLVYALVLGSFHPWDLVLGAVISIGLILTFRRFVFGEPTASDGGMVRRIVAFLPFAAATVWNVVKGTWEVSLVTLGLRSLDQPGMVAIPFGERTPTGVAVSALASTLSPGTVLIEVDREREVFLIHAIDASDPEAVRREHQEFYERYQKRVFP